MTSNESSQIGGQAAAPALLPPVNPPLEGIPGVAPAGPQLAPKTFGYGLPCAKCRTYYSAALSACPVCKNTERVSPTLQAITVSAPAMSEVTPDPEVLEQERERFLQEFRAQMGAGELQSEALTSSRCVHVENHEGSLEPAAVCQGCYDNLRERADHFEAALLIDVKEATQIIYDAVWSNPSDPGKTYQNAAQALLNELRQRAGISLMFGSMQPLQH